MSHITYNPSTKALAEPVTRTAVFQIPGLHHKSADEIEAVREYLTQIINRMTPRGSAVRVAFKATGQADVHSYGPQFYGGGWDQSTRNACWEGFRQAIREARQDLRWRNI